MTEHNHGDIYEDLDRQAKKIKRLESRISALESKAELRENDCFDNLDRIQILENKMSNLEKGILK